MLEPRKIEYSDNFAQKIDVNRKKQIMDHEKSW